MAGDTGATGMPISKNLDVEVEPVIDGAPESGEPHHG
jgi:hypothetical protein